MTIRPTPPSLKQSGGPGAALCCGYLQACSSSRCSGGVRARARLDRPAEAPACFRSGRLVSLARAVLTMDEARRIASNIAKLPTLLPRK